MPPPRKKPNKRSLYYLFTTPLLVQALVNLRQRFRARLAPLLDDDSAADAGQRRAIIDAVAVACAIIIAGAVHSAATATAATTIATSAATGAAAERVHVGPAQLGRYRLARNSSQTSAHTKNIKTMKSIKTKKKKKNTIIISKCPIIILNVETIIRSRQKSISQWLRLAK